MSEFKEKYITNKRVLLFTIFPIKHVSNKIKETIVNGRGIMKLVNGERIHLPEYGI